MSDDLISRAAALKGLEDLNIASFYEENEHSKEAYTEVKAMLKALPPAQPVVISKSENATECEDAVSRFEVLRLIDYSSHDLNDAVDNRYMQNEIKQLPSVTPKQPGWIPCDRELPKPNEEDGNGFYKAYLVQDGRWMDVARWDGKYWVAWGYSTVLLNVVAWCELPTPYREGGQE